MVSSTRVCIANIVFVLVVVLTNQLVLAQSMILVIGLDMAMLFITTLSINVKLASVSTLIVDSTAKLSLMSQFVHSM